MNNTVRPQAEEESARGRDYYLALLEDLPVMVWRADARGWCDYVNRTLLEFTGRAPEEEYGFGWMDNIHPADREKCKRVFLTAWRNREPVEMQFRFHRHDGEYRWIFGRGRPFLDPEGQFAGYIGSCDDFTDRRLAKEALAEAEQKFRLLAENATDVIWQVDAAGVIAYISPAVRRYGFEPEDLVGRSLGVIVPPQEQGGLCEVLRLLLQEPGSVTIEVELTRAEGGTMPVEMSMTSSRGPDGAMVIQGIDRDITGRRLAEQSLAAAEQKYRFLAENGPDVIFQLDCTGAITYVSQGVRRYGMEPEDLLGKSWEVVVPPPVREGVREGLVPLFHQSGSVTKEFMMPLTDGTAITVEVSFISRRGPDGTMSIQGFDRDISERKGMETQLRHTLFQLSRSNEDLERFAYVASHDLQEPLRMITGYLELLEERYRDQLDDRAQEFIGFAVDGAERMRNLIEQLLAYSRLGRREQGAVPVDLNAIVDDVLADLAHTLAETGAEVTRDYLPLLLGIPGQLTQLYQNLLANALKFRGTNPVRIRLGATRLNGDWLLSVTDNGIGIAAEYHQDIFVIFRRLHTREEYAGTGLGLALCKRIVDQHSGRIWVESEPNRGTTFWFTLPAPTDAH